MVGKGFLERVPLVWELQIGQEGYIHPQDISGYGHRIPLVPTVSMLILLCWEGRLSKRTARCCKLCSSNLFIDFAKRS